jgi:hypothetical protein
MGKISGKTNAIVCAEAASSQGVCRAPARAFAPVHRSLAAFLDILAPVIVAASVIAAGSARADVVAFKPCVLADGAPALPSVRSLEALQRKRAMPHLLRCDNVDPAQPPIWFIATDVRKSVRRVCGYDTVQIVLDRAGRNPIWTDIFVDRATKLWEAKASACPQLGDPRYLHTRGVAEDIFLALTAFWNDLTSSPKRFDALVPRKKAGARSLRAELFGATATTKTVRLGSITAKTTELRGGICSRTPCYKLGVGNGRFVTVAILADGGISVVDISFVVF